MNRLQLTNFRVRTRLARQRAIIRRRVAELKAQQTCAQDEPVETRELEEETGIEPRRAAGSRG